MDGVIFHTDQGSEYTASLFAKACTAAGVRQSMGRTGMKSPQRWSGGKASLG